VPTDAPPTDVLDRVHIIGAPGSGKSTLARQVAHAQGPAPIDLDELPHPAVTDRSAEWDDLAVWDYFRQSAAAIALQGRWVTEGIYSGWTEPLLDRAMTVVWLDLPVTLAIRRILWRHLRRSLAGTNAHKGIRTLIRFCRNVWSDPRRPAATDEQLQRDVGLNSRATVEQRLGPHHDKVIHCRSQADVHRLVTRWKLPAPDPT
jgi:adenylate kinase family enzyme